MLTASALEVAILTVEVSARFLGAERTFRTERALAASAEMRACGTGILIVALAALERFARGVVAALLARLDLASGSAVLVEASVEEHIFAQLAFERTVVERRLHRWPQTYLLEALLVEAQYPSFAAAELALELLADGLVEA